MLIEIKGVQFVNKGAELMLHAILQKAKAIWPDAEFCLAPNPLSPYLKRADVGAFQKLGLKKNVLDLNGLFYFLPLSIRKKLKSKWGIVTEADIDIVLDASGFAYGDQWNTLILKQTAIEARRLKRKNKHYIFMPQALGPFTSSANKAAAKNAFEASSIVFAREVESFANVNTCSENTHVILSPDFTNLVTAELKHEFEPFKDKIAIVPNSKMLSAKNKNALWRQNYLSILVKTIKAYQALGESVFLLNHEGKSDLNICNEINALLNSKLEVLSPDSSLDVKAIIGQSKAVVCSRYHGCVSALSQGVPCLGTSWSHKYEKLFSEYGVSSMLLTPELPDKNLEDLVRYSINEQALIKNILEPKITEFKALSEKMWKKVTKVINAK